MRSSVALCLTLALSGCVVVPLGTDVVRDEDHAIEIAQVACRGARAGDSSERWHAVLHGGKWYAWLGHLSEPEASSWYVWIRAKDGYVLSEMGDYVPDAQAGCVLMAREPKSY